MNYKYTRTTPASCSPAGRHATNILTMETVPFWERVQKRRGSIGFYLAYPYNQALALPLLKDKQRKACPRRVNIDIHYGVAFPDIHIYTDIPR